MEVITEINPYQELLQRLNDRTEHLSFSSFNQFCESPRHFIAYKLEKKAPTPAMVFGSMVHCMVLEEEDFENRYQVLDMKTPSGSALEFCNKIIAGYSLEEAFCLSGWLIPSDPIKLVANATKKRSEYGEYIELHLGAKAAGMEIVTQSDYDDARRIKKELYRNNATRWVLDQLTETERQIEWQYGGYNWKGFIDGEGETIRCDLKSTADASPRKMRRKILYDFHYNRQAALYTYGSGGHKDFYFVNFDRGGNTSVIKLDENDLRYAWQEIEDYMEDFKRCVFMDAWNESYNFFGPKNGIYELSEI